VAASGVQSRSALARAVPPRLAARLRQAAAVGAVFLFWEIAARIAANRLLPAPYDVFASLAEGITDGLIWYNAQLTFQRGVTGLAIALLAGITVGVAMARSRWVEAVLEPIIAATYPIPKLALYPFLILLLGFGGTSKVAMVALECAYPLVWNVYAGVRNIDRRYLWVGRNAGAGRAAMLGLLLRAATPAVMAGLRLALPVMLVIMVVTELIGESRGLGFLIRQAGTNFQPADALAVVLLLALLGFVLDRLVVAATRRLAFWSRGVRL
jgi:NitT/TauT family transport system permease protein